MSRLDAGANRAARRAQKFGHRREDAAPKAASSAPPQVAEAARTASAPILPRLVNQLDMAFGGGPDMEKLFMVPMADIPVEFQHGHTKWNDLASRWFFSGLPRETEFVPKAGIDSNVALRHLATIQGSFAPKHEHKEACVAYLMSLWFDDVRIPGAQAVSI